jgi:hypothetical protein
MNPKDFGLTEPMIAAAKMLLVATAFEQLVRTIVVQYEQEILDRLQLRTDERFIEHGINHVVLQRNEVSLLSDSDREVFYQETFKARDAAKLPVNDPRDCPLIAAELNRLNAEKALMAALLAHPKLCDTAKAYSSGFLNVDEQKKVVHLTLCLFAPFVNDAEVLLKEMLTHINHKN